MNSYTTVQGDTWDLIAYKLWGSEYLLPLLFDANPKHANTLFFKAGVVLNVPDIEEETDEIDRPPWFEEAVEP